MLKIMGSVMVVLAGLGMGFFFSENLNCQNRQLKQLKKMVLLLRGEMNYHHTYLSKACCDVSGKTEEPFRSVLNYAAKQADKNTECSFAQIWEDATDRFLKQSALSTEQIQKIKELGTTMGYLDIETQNSGFRLFLEQLDMEIEENNERRKKDGKVYKYLGFMGGVIVVLIII